MNFRRTDIQILEAAAIRGGLGIKSLAYSAAARRRLIRAGLIFEGERSIRVGIYRSTLRITEEGRHALSSFKQGERP